MNADLFQCLSLPLPSQAAPLEDSPARLAALLDAACDDFQAIHLQLELLELPQTDASAIALLLRRLRHAEALLRQEYALTQYGH